MKSCILYIKLVYPDAPSTSLLDPGKSFLLSGISSYKDLEVYAFGAPEVKKSPSLGRIFSQIEPCEDGSFLVELGAVLPDLFPNLNDELDYAVEVVDEDGEPNTLCISNQMVKISNRVEDEQYHVLLPRCHLEKLYNEHVNFKIPEDAPHDLQRTMVSSRFTVSGKDAEDALEKDIDTIIERFISQINRFLAANQMMLNDDASHAVPSAYDRTTFGNLYLILVGKDKQIAHGRFALNVIKVMLQPGSLKGVEADKLIAYLNGSMPINDVRGMAISAKSALQGGMLRYGLLQTVIVAEMGTARFVRKQLLEKGVSNSKWGEIGRDITYSMMLNIHLHALSPAHLKPDRNIIGILNRARKARNDLMHMGKFELKSSELHEIHQITLQYLDYLAQLEKWFREQIESTEIS